MIVTNPYCPTTSVPQKGTTNNTEWAWSMTLCAMHVTATNNSHHSLGCMHTSLLDKLGSLLHTCTSHMSKVSKSVLYKAIVFFWSRILYHMIVMFVHDHIMWFFFEFIEQRTGISVTTARAFLPYEWGLRMEQLLIRWSSPYNIVPMTIIFDFPPFLSLGASRNAALSPGPFPAFQYCTLKRKNGRPGATKTRLQEYTYSWGWD